MADYMAAEIEIGGPVPAPLVPTLIEKIRNEGLFVGWEEHKFDAQTANDLLRFSGEREERTLHLARCEVAWGEFGDLEKFLVEHRIAFDRRTEARYEYDAELIQYRPGMKRPVALLVNRDGEQVVPVSFLKRLPNALQRGRTQYVLRALQRLLGPEIPPLEPLTIVPTTKRKRPCPSRSRKRIGI